MSTRAREMTYPQAGVVTSLDRQSGRAKVYLPLFGIETDWIAVATNLLYEERLEVSELRLEPLNPEGIEDPHPGIGHTFQVAHAGCVARVDFGTLRVGDEVLVLFLNGDLNEGVVFARL